MKLFFKTIFNYRFTGKNISWIRNHSNFGPSSLYQFIKKFNFKIILYFTVNNALLLYIEIN